MRTCHACSDGRHFKHTSNKKQIGSVTARKPASGSRPSSVLSGKLKSTHKIPSIEVGPSTASPTIALRTPSTCAQRSSTPVQTPSVRVESTPVDASSPLVDDGSPVPVQTPSVCHESTLADAGSSPTSPLHDAPFAADGPSTTLPIPIHIPDEPTAESTPSLLPSETPSLDDNFSTESPVPSVCQESTLVDASSSPTSPLHDAPFAADGPSTTLPIPIHIPDEPTAESTPSLLPSETPSLDDNFSTESPVPSVCQESTLADASLSMASPLHETSETPSLDDNFSTESPVTVRTHSVGHELTLVDVSSPTPSLLPDETPVDVNFSSESPVLAEIPSVARNRSLRRYPTWIVAVILALVSQHCYMSELYTGVWALHLKPGVPSVIHPRENVHISNAAVDASNSKARTTVKLVANIPAWDGGSKTTAPPGRMSIILGSFTPGQVEQFGLNIFLERGQSYTLEAAGCSDIFLSGNLVDMGHKTTDLKRKPATQGEVAQKRRATNDIEAKPTSSSTAANVLARPDVAQPIATPREFLSRPAAAPYPGQLAARPVINTSTRPGVAQATATPRGVTVTVQDATKGNTDSEPARLGCMVEVYYLVKDAAGNVIRKHTTKPPYRVRLGQCEIRGLSEGVNGMFESGERRITVPATKDFALTYIEQNSD
ncbi:hypothetical protein EYR36_001257 [Pleurotus pulmonarius]|nr:hypothetical protein EYR36_001257 [Pleurotus pulmonarius]